jgi:hypothetical protein
VRKIRTTKVLLRRGDYPAGTVATVIRKGRAEGSIYVEFEDRRQVLVHYNEYEEEG